MPPLSWEPDAEQLLQRSLSQAPLPGMLRSRVQNELRAAAEAAAHAAGRTQVTAPDLLQGLLTRLPSAMRAKVETAMQAGPEGLKNLAQDLQP